MPVCYFRQRYKLSGQLILQQRGLRRFPAYSRLSCAGFSACGLFALITEHICHDETSIDTVK
jgi:hypothetical protein